MSNPNPPGKKLGPEKFARIRAEAAAPYRGLRKFIYLGFAVSGGVGGFVFLAQLAAGRDVATAFPNFALQVGVVALMVLLLRVENRAEQRSQNQQQQQQQQKKKPSNRSQ
ncbi:MAG: DUF3493 domain-containing protein [Cyanobacteria bacterium P01_H01_bin.15]